MRVVETGDDSGFVQVSLNIFGLGDPLLTGNFDRNRAIKILIKCQEYLPEPALSQTSEDGVTIDLRRMEK